MEQSRLIVLSALTVVALAYAGHHLISKAATMHGASPLMLAAVRSVLGTAVMYVVAQIVEGGVKEKAARAITDWKSFGPLGIATAGNIVGFLFGAKFLSALTCSIMQPAVPVITCILCVSCGMEEISIAKAASIIFSGLGAVIVLTHGEQTASLGATSTTDLIHGSIFIGMNVFSNACYWTYQKRVLKEYPPVTTTATAYLFAAAIICTIALVTGQGRNVNAWMLEGNTFVWTCMAYIILISTVFTYCVQGWANSQSSPTVVTVFMALPPFFATIISALFLGAIISAGQMVGGTCIVVGLILNAKSQADAEQAAERSKLVESP